MTITAPPRPPRPSDPVDREEVEALVEALFEEARQRARRRRRVRLAVVACVVLVGATIFAIFERTAESQSSSPASTAGSSISGGKVKVVIAFPNPPTVDGNVSSKGTFRASGAITDAGTVLGYRTGGPDNPLITLRFVTKGKKGTITYVVKIDLNATNPDAAARWRITSGTKAYQGLHGKGTTSVNASYTVRILRGTVSR